jgi:5'-3' exonuclease
MILIDMSQILFASASMSMKSGKADINIIRHMTLNSLKKYRKEYFDEYGELIICCDGKHSWRREFFPQYKAARKSGRETSSVNWSEVFEIFNQLKNEIKENFPYRVIHVDTAEADDIIGTLVLRGREEGEKTLIISSDKDFIQLQMNDNVYQYSPITKKFLNGVDPNEYLKEHILRGDKGDGIPNVLSDDNVIVDRIRQTPITKKNLEVWMGGSLPKEHAERHERNTELIDLRYTPWHLQNTILKQKEQEPVGNRNKLPAYFKEHKLEVLSTHIRDF